MTQDQQDALFAQRLKAQHEERKALACNEERLKQCVRDMTAAARSLERRLNWQVFSEEIGTAARAMPKTDFEDLPYPSREEIEGALAEMRRLKTSMDERAGFLDQIIPGSSRV